MSFSRIEAWEIGEEESLAVKGKIVREKTA
jgi:hypothetical protein